MDTYMEKPCFFIQDSAIILYAYNFDSIINYRNKVDENILNNNINAFVVICNSQYTDLHMSSDQKAELYMWMKAFPIPSIIVFDNNCHGDLLELAMMFDIRLGGKNLTIKFPEEASSIVFNYDQQCSLLMGNNSDFLQQDSLLNRALNSEEAYSLHFVNQIIDFDDAENEASSYIKKILGNKDNDHIKAIIKCFNHYKHLGLSADRDLLLEEEARQFCNLIVRSYMNTRVNYED